MRRQLRAMWPAAPAAIIGASAWIVWNLAHGFDSLHQLDAGMQTSYGTRLHLFFSRLLPMVLGVRRPYTGGWLLGARVGVALYVAALVAFAVLCVRVARRRAARERFGLLVAIAIAFPFLFAVPRTSYYVQAPRYGLMLTPVVALLVVAAARHRIAQWVALAIACALATSTVASTIDYGRSHPLTVDLVPPHLQPLEDALTAAGVTRVYADYWLAYTLTFDTDERIIGSPVDYIRSVKYEVAVDAARDSTYVVFRGRPRDRGLRAVLDDRAIAYRHTDVGLFSIYFLRAHVEPRGLAAVWKLASP
jgi:hypothetical protein